MRIKLSVFVAVAAIAMVIAGCSQASAPIVTETTAPPTPTPAKVFVSETGRFSAALPEDPIEDVQTLPTSAGDLEVHFFTLEKENAIYMVVYSDYPAEVVAQSSPTVMLDGARDGAVSNVQGTLLNEEEITINDYPGRALKVRASDGQATVHSRVYLVDNRLYQVMVVIPGSADLPTEAEDFLDSFKVM